MKFFGESIIQVLVKDQSTSDSSNDEISLSIDAEKARNVATTTETFSIPNTSEGSQKFEFFLVHSGSKYADGVDEDNSNKPLDANNINGIDDPADGFNGIGAPIIRFGTDEGSGVELSTGTALYEPITLTIKYKDVSIKIEYDETFAKLSLDRSSYGTDNFVYITIKDQDANLNPFERDEFVIDPNNNPNGDLLMLIGGAFSDTIVYRETGDNTGIFEGKYRLGTSINVDSESLSITLHDKANYNANLDASENDSNATDEVSFTVGDSNGSIAVGGISNQSNNQTIIAWDPVLTVNKKLFEIGEIVQVNITDQDANINPDLIDSINMQVLSSSNFVTDLSAVETGKDSGVFEAKFVVGTKTNTTLKSIAAESGSTFTIMYIDKHPADFSEKVQKGENPETNFTSEIGILNADFEAITVQAPSIIDANENSSNKTGTYAVGNQLAISTNMTNNNASQDQPFVTIIEVRDNHGMTVFLGWHSGIINQGSSSNVQVSWSPTEDGIYQIRTFAISGFDNTEVLSPVASTEITVQ